MTPSHELWAAQARYDFEVATTLFESGRYLYVMFFCQQTVEKMLKSIIAKRSNQTPPRIHNLMLLAQRAGIEVNEERAGFFRELSQYYIQSRYPEELSAIASGISSQLVGATIVRTEAAIQWLSSIK